MLFWISMLPGMVLPSLLLVIEHAANVAHGVF
jgi:hypothetical protein